MNYELEFLPQAKKEWDKLDSNNKKHFKKKLLKILSNPEIPKNKLHGISNCYKIKLKNSGYRLVYEVSLSKVIVQVIAVGRRDKNQIYKIAKSRVLQKQEQNRQKK